MHRIALTLAVLLTLFAVPCLLLGSGSWVITVESIRK